MKILLQADAATASGGKKSDPLANARAALKPKDPNAYKPTPNERYAINQARQAGKACKMVADLLQQGKHPSGEVMQACAILSGAVASSLFAE